ncbi:TIGR03435 family protein [Acidipila sp. EB88]|uniref:TIGR03435 family protein n=1 Tax=Acidipila sp. EB88 TaxID=2305226 RepID=UPI0013153607|nr:TIGR03435 family protein [Acidipila sp. EB88]
MNEAESRARSVVRLIVLSLPLLAYNCPSLCYQAARAADGVESAEMHQETPTKHLAADVVSVSPTKDTGRWKLQDISVGWIGRNVTLLMLVQEAYHVDGAHLLNLPAWARSDHYDMDAKVAAADVAVFSQMSYDQHRVLLQDVLADRFKLSVHIESQERPVYALVVARGGAKLGKPRPDQWCAQPAQQGRTLFVQARAGLMSVECIRMSGLADVLSRGNDRPVIDKTGISGFYNVDLRWMPEADAAKAQAVSSSTEESGPSLFTALQEQLGLRLDPQKGPIPFLVIDRVEPPSAN